MSQKQIHLNSIVKNVDGFRVPVDVCIRRLHFYCRYIISISINGIRRKSGTHWRAWTFALCAVRMSCHIAFPCAYPSSYVRQLSRNAHVSVNVTTCITTLPNPGLPDYNILVNVIFQYQNIVIITDFSNWPSNLAKISGYQLRLSSIPTLDITISFHDRKLYYPLSST